MGAAIEILAAIALGLLVCWLALLVVLWRLRPRQGVATEALRAVPDVVRLTHRLARDPLLPRMLRIWLWLLLGYLVSPIDLVPDFIPVIGYADDAVIVALVLRAVVRRAGREAVTRHWPGSAVGLDAVERLAGIARA
jgi:uncharacterized membrane protein YkvA (DUF1232 family)